jgi:hypothetical protein
MQYLSQKAEFLQLFTAFGRNKKLFLLSKSNNQQLQLLGFSCQAKF